MPSWLAAISSSFACLRRYGGSRGLRPNWGAKVGINLITAKGKGEKIAFFNFTTIPRNDSALLSK